ncbi:Predicted nucleic acid-binding protein, contains PIN domain [Agrococcus baldri]|uniref:Ribonuclease VapC n=1 Tax=Agrococcus baldri TaxID=153730 RepID=A0AA94HKY7_9MICO|nr:type II toxin-antitoxin system VapC family toxin [Agrococcus baldri]SFR98366.1 Predicted nucleic acid-binding protein, contains PIN domain [Agrococcus baldri]
MKVVDASVLVNALGDDGDAGRSARAALRAADEFTAPDLINVEVMAALRRLWLAGSLSDAQFEAASSDLQQLAFPRVPTRHLVTRAYDLRASVSAYDAMYVALAEALDCDLLTGDRRLANANGPRCRIRVVR